MTGVLALFPGLAAVAPGMAASLMEMDVALASLDEFERVSGCPVTELATSAPSEILLADRNCELAVISTSIAATSAWRSAGGEVDGVLGFSIGVYAALHAAGVLNLEQVVTVVDIVLQASRELEGVFEMVAVTGIGRRELELACRKAGTDVVAEMTAAQFLVVGRHPAVALLEIGLSHRALRWRSLPVRWPLHTTFMRPVASALENARARIGPLSQPRVQVYSAARPYRIRDASAAWELLTSQLWTTQSLPRAFHAAVSDGFDRAVDLGPGDSMRRALRWTCRDRVTVHVPWWHRSEGRA